MSWSVEPEGTILMGGFPDDWITLNSIQFNSKFRNSLNSSEIVKHDGTTEKTFDLKYGLVYVYFVIL